MADEPTVVDEPTPPHFNLESWPISYRTAESVDLNARAYGWVIGQMGLVAGDPLPEKITSTTCNPFLNPDWRTQEPTMDHTNPSLSLFDILQSAYDAGAEDAVREGSFASWLGAQVEEGVLSLTVA